MLSIPDLQYAISMTKLGHGYVAINNSISAQIFNICIGIGLPMLIKSITTGGGVEIPGHKLVGECSIFLAVGILVFIGMTLIPAYIKKEDKCTVDDIRGKILVAVAILLLIVFVVLNLRKAYVCLLETYSSFYLDDLCYLRVENGMMGYADYLSFQFDHHIID